VSRVRLSTRPAGGAQACRTRTVSGADPVPQ